MAASATVQSLVRGPGRTTGRVPSRPPGGEYFIRTAVAHDIHARMLHGGETLAEAAERTIQTKWEPLVAMEELLAWTARDAPPSA